MPDKMQKITDRISEYGRIFATAGITPKNVFMH
jgi:hypothetical protein